MRNVITLGGDYIDPSKHIDRLIADNTLYVDPEEMTDVLVGTDRELTTADDHTSAWLHRIAAANRTSIEL